MGAGQGSGGADTRDEASRARRAWCSLLPLLLALACAQAKEIGKEVAWGLSPIGARDTSVMHVEVRGPYLLAALRGSKIDLNFLVPANEVCARVLAPEARVTYAKHGIYGRISREGESCDAVGIASLAAWRNRQPRARGRAFPRGTARFELIYRDDDIVLVRGEFPLANRIGIPGGYDLVAVLPNTESCSVPVERGEASIEYHDSGREPYRLVGSEGPCPVLGFASPLEAAGSGG